MNKFIRSQLEKCRVAQIPHYEKDTTHLFIPKSEKSIFEIRYPNQPTQLNINGWEEINFK